MIEGLQPYPEMKDSGVPWLAEVPAHWQVLRLKQTFSRVVGGSTPSSTNPAFWDGDIVWVTPADISKNTVVKDSLRRITDDGLRSCSSELVPRGSLIVTSRAPVGNVAIAATDLCTNQGCKALVRNPAVVNSIFGFHVLTTLRDELQSLAVGTTFVEISSSRIGSVRFPLPPESEQTAIVRFLGHVDRRIQRYIRAKQKLIKLLEEQKQAIIHQAVTRGLDPNVRLKPSGVEWLGDVPEHWGVVRLGSLLRERGENNEHGAMTYVLSLLRDRGVIPYDEKGNIGNKKSEDITRYKIVRPGDIVVNCMNVIIGSVGLSRYAGCLSPVYYVLVRRSARDDPSFLDAVFQCSRFHQSLVRIGNGILAHRMRIPMELLKCELLPHPPAEEQMQIVRAIREWTRSCDDAIARAFQEISLFREFHTRLISDVVTGKLDVREAAARLPAEAEEPETLDEVEEGTGAVEVSEGALDDVLEGVEV